MKFIPKTPHPNDFLWIFPFPDFSTTQCWPFVSKVTRPAASQTPGKVIQLCTIQPHKNGQRLILEPPIWDQMNTKERVVNQETEAVNFLIDFQMAYYMLI
ncbi:unnamed protein product [Amaranthus hypochondriacus]